METAWRFAKTYARPYLPWFAAGTVALAVTNGLSVEIPMALARGIDALGRQDPGGAVRSALLVAAMGVLVIGVRTASRLLFFTPGRWIEAALQRDLFDAILRQQPEFFAKLRPGDLTSRLTADVQSARLLFGFTTLGLVNTATAVALTGIQMVRISPPLALAAAAPLLLGFAVTAVAVDRMRDLARRSQEALAALSDAALASFQGIAAIQAFGAQGAALDAFRAPNHDLARASVARAGLRVLIGPLLGLAAAIDVYLLLALGGPRAIAGTVSTGDLVAFVALVGYVAGPLRNMTFTLSVARQAQASIDRLGEVLFAVPNRPDLPHPAAAPRGPPAIELRSLSYRYPGADRDALGDVSIALPPGGVLGVFGPTGSGKTTLVRCLLRLCDPPPRTVLVDGVDVRGVDLDAWRDAAALVPQRAFLFSESVRDNVLLGAPDGGRLDVLVGAAQLRVDVEALPDGVGTVVGEAGLTLSGGQRQRVALARGLAREAHVLVLDDVLSAVDHATEAALIDTLRRSGTRPTTVIVANRCSALRHADVVVVLEAGRKVDAGTHEELVSRPGLYAEAWRRQTEGLG